MAILQLCLYLFFGFCGFCVTMFVIHRAMYHSTADEAEKAVKALLKEFAADLFHIHEPLEPAPNNELIDKIKDILASVNKTTKEDIVYNSSYCPFGFYMPYFDITVPEDTDFQMLKIRLEKVVLHYLCKNVMNSSPIVYVYFEKYGDFQYYAYVAYACYANSQKILKTFVINRTRINKRNAINGEKPKICDTLENELSDMKKGDRNGEF